MNEQSEGMTHLLVRRAGMHKLHESFSGRVIFFIYSSPSLERPSLNPDKNRSYKRDGLTIEVNLCSKYNIYEKYSLSGEVVFQ